MGNRRFDTRKELLLHLRSFSNCDGLSRFRRTIPRLPSAFGRALAKSTPLFFARLLSKNGPTRGRRDREFAAEFPDQTCLCLLVSREAAMSQHVGNSTNLELLEQFWRRSSFHDRLIEEVAALNKRVVIRLADLTLIITQATELERCALPAVWLRESIITKREGFSIDVETDTGRLRVAGRDVRLIRNSDLAVLIPPIDG